MSKPVDWRQRHQVRVAEFEATLNRFEKESNLLKASLAALEAEKNSYETAIKQSKVAHKAVKAQEPHAKKEHEARMARSTERIGKITERIEAQKDHQLKLEEQINIYAEKPLPP